MRVSIFCHCEEWSKPVFLFLCVLVCHPVWIPFRLILRDIDSLFLISGGKRDSFARLSEWQKVGRSKNSQKQNGAIASKKQFIFNENYSHNMKNPLICKRIFCYMISFWISGVWVCDFPLRYSLMTLLMRRAFSIGFGAYLITILDVSLAVRICTSPNPNIVWSIPAVCALTSWTLSSEHSLTLRESADIWSIPMIRVSVMTKRSSSSLIQSRRIKVKNTIQKIDMAPQNIAPPVIDIILSLYMRRNILVITSMNIYKKWNTRIIQCLWSVIMRRSPSRRREIFSCLIMLCVVLWSKGVRGFVCTLHFRMIFELYRYLPYIV